MGDVAGGGDNFTGVEHDAETGLPPLKDPTGIDEDDVGEDDGRAKVRLD